MNKLEQEVFIWDVWVICFGLYLAHQRPELVSGRAFMVCDDRGDSCGDAVF